MDVIKDLNQFVINSIKFILNSKIRSDFDFSFELCWPLVKVFNTKVAPNNLFYLLEKFHIFRRPIAISFDLISFLCRNQLNQIPNSNSFP
jgi:hypothetical protein